MIYKTYKQLKDKVREDLGIEQEEFVKPVELLGYCNAAISFIEAQIHKMYEDYFLTTVKIGTLAGQEGYALPTNIYANKIRGLIYVRGNEVYTIKRYAHRDNLFERLERDRLSSSDVYTYFLNNLSATEGIELQLIPTPRNDESEALRLYYIRSANKMVDDTSLCDIPEFYDYVIQFMKVRCYEKEGHPNTAFAAGFLEVLGTNMDTTLSNMVPDGEAHIGMDVSIYGDMHDDIGFGN